MKWSGQNTGTLPVLATACFLLRVLLFPDVAHACQCINHTEQEHIDDADAVFEGTVLKEELAHSALWAHFQISQTLKLNEAAKKGASEYAKGGRKGDSLPPAPQHLQYAFYGAEILQGFRQSRADVRSKTVPDNRFMFRYTRNQTVDALYPHRNFFRGS